jgi:hypothetical protein
MLSVTRGSYRTLGRRSSLISLKYFYCEDQNPGEALEKKRVTPCAPITFSPVIL